MQLLKKLTLSLLLATAVISTNSNAQVNPQSVKYPETPVNTLFIKHPAANDPATYFATSTIFSFYIYKPTSISKVSGTFKKEADVENCTVGALTGDYQQIDISVKAAKDKMWYIALFKKAGLNTVKINNNLITETDKM